MTRPERCLALLAALLMACTLSSPLHAQSSATGQSGAAPGAHVSDVPEFDAGFHELYELKFQPARERFVAWERQNPTDPLGPALEAAADLFEEFYRKGVLTSAAQRSEQFARQRLAIHPADANALFALTLSAGMRADNASLLEKKQIESLGFLREADRNAKTLLAVAPDTADAYLALGAADYIIGCLPGYKRMLLRVGGVRGDRIVGIHELERTASSGHYLRPYAKLMLALADLREKNPGPAREQLAQLAAEFPENELFARELLKASAAVARTSHPAD